MKLLTFHIMKRMTINFIVLFTLFFLLGAVIDIIINLDEFDKIANSLSKDGGFFAKIFALIQVGIGFEGPRLFQVYGYLHGVIAIGAMAFTAANMLRSKEFVALMAAGISLRSIAMPFLIVMGGISVVALLNQEYMLPRVAPLLLRDHGELGKDSVGSFSVPFTPDQSGVLLLAPSLNPATGEIKEPTFLVRDDKGRMIRQIRATSATWDGVASGRWILQNGRAVDVVFDEETAQAEILPPIDVAYYETELSPYILTLHRYGQFIGMLGMTQLNSMLEVAGTFDAPMLRRHWYSRFASIAINILTMIIVIPLFVTREPVILSRQAMKCGGIALTILFGGTIVMLMPVQGFPAVVSVFLPVLVLFPVGLLQLVNIRT
jgi:lipopolysaccharide export LptBFGC system permease protein LptF